MLVVRQPGITKTLLVNEATQAACEHPELTCDSVRYDGMGCDRALMRIEGTIQGAFHSSKGALPSSLASGVRLPAATSVPAERFDDVVGPFAVFLGLNRDAEEAFML